MKPAIDLIAKHCGVSKATVSRVLNRKPYVKEEIRRKVLDAFEKFDYSPRQMAVRKLVVIAMTSLRSRIGLYESTIVSGITSNLMDKGVSVRVQSTEDLDLERSFDAGCVIVTSFHSEDQFKLPKGAPAILFNNVRKGFHSVRSDHAQGVELALERLFGMGHRRVAFLVGGWDGWGNVERVRGYREGVRKLGLADEPGLLQAYGGASSMVESVAKVLLQKPSALIVSGEDAAIEANYALKVLGQSVPEGLSLVTYENASVSRHMWPPNSTIDQDFETITANAAELAASIVNGEAPSRPVELVSLNKFNLRDSTRRFDAAKGKASQR